MRKGTRNIKLCKSLKIVINIKSGKKLLCGSNCKFLTPRLNGAGPFSDGSYSAVCALFTETKNRRELDQKEAFYKRCKKCLEAFGTKE